MQLAFGWYNIIELLLCLVALWMGIRPAARFTDPHLFQPI